MIPMVDLTAQFAGLRSEIERALRDVLDSGAFILGPNVRAFETEAAAYLGVKHTVGCASGTDALHLLLRAAGIGAGDEVITTAFTFIGTAEAIAYVGAKPVFVDIDPRTFNIDSGAIEVAITDRTKAVMPVHLFGQPVDLVRIASLCEHYHLALIEDCAQSFGASIQGRQTGSWGIGGGFSFFPSKNLGCYGDGGLIATQSEELATRLRMLGNHGSAVRYRHDLLGYNSRLDEIQAAILRVKLRHLDAFNAGRQRVAALYDELLAGLPVAMPYADGIGAHVYHQYTLLSDQRDSIAKALQEGGIASAIYYPTPLHRQPVFAEACSTVSLPHTESVAARCLSLPMYPELDATTIERIAATIRLAVGG
jgi:dTDP-4-amino-4,6-dideoxygalactose transaminase